MASVAFCQKQGDVCRHNIAYLAFDELRGMMRKKIVYIVYVSLVILVLLELLLRLFHVNVTYMESIGKPYQSGYNQTFHSHYFVHQPNSSVELDHHDFSYVHTYNELGLRDIPVDSFLKLCAHSYRILVLGDSYTEGVGAPSDSSWVRILEKKLRQKGHRACCFNAGISGSDPFFQYVLYRDKLHMLDFDMVVLAINTTDVDDYVFRGGMERFQPDGSVRTRQGPWYECLYKYSYVYRLIDRLIFRHKKQMFITQREYDAMADRFIIETAALLQQWQTLAADTIKLLVTAFPSPDEAARYQLRNQSVREKALEKVLHNAQQTGLLTLNLYPFFSAIINLRNLPQYTYKNDRHYNSAGYDHFAHWVAPVIDSMIIFSSVTSRQGLAGQ